MSDTPNDNKELFVRLADGDEKAFRNLFDLYRLPFFSAAIKLTRSAEIAEDIVQDVFVSLWLNRHLVAEARNPIGYLVTILHNRTNKALRAIILERQAINRATDENSAEEVYEVEELLLEKENRERLNAIINKMPPQQQLIYKLSRHEQLSRDEIAKKMNLSPNTVRNHLAAATDLIKQSFNKESSAIILSVIWSQL